MGTCKVFDWTRTVLSSEYLSLIPSTVDRSAFFKKIADRLTLVTDQNETNGHPAFQGQWINIVKAEVILTEFVTKLNNSRQKSNGQKHGIMTDHASELVEVVPDIHYSHRESVDSFPSNEVRCVPESTDREVKKEVDPLEGSDHNEKNIDRESKNEELQELYMNITVSPFKECSKKKDNSVEEKLIWDQTDKETGENPLDNVYLLLKVDEKEEKEKSRCPETDRKRKYEDSLPFKYFCLHCSFKSKRENHFLKHCRLHEKPRKLYMCGRCDFKTIRISTLRRHELVHSENKLLLCDLCPYKTDDPKFLFKHHNLKHSGNKKLLKCTQCSYSSGSQRELRNHTMTHKPTQPTTIWNCEQCPYNSRLKSHLQRHINDVHSSRRPFLCHYCGKCFKRHDTLKQHKITHGEIGAIHTCDQCGKTSTCASQLKQHMTVHTVLRPYICDQCGASFKTQSNKRKHIRTLHSAEAPFPCTQCKQTFKSNKSLLRHLRTHRTKTETAVQEIAPKPKEIAPKLIIPNIVVDTANDATAPVTIQVVYCNVDGSDRPDLVFQ